MHDIRVGAGLASEATDQAVVLFVCAANVCRSPLMELTFGETPLSESHGQVWTATSRGVNVSHAASMCDVTSSLLDDVASPDAIASHAATPVDSENLASYDIIIAASRAERAAIALLQPSLRTRTFTIKEAVALGHEPLEPGELGRASRATRSNAEEASPVALYAAVLNARRGSVDLSTQPRRRLPWSQAEDPMDVPDAHHENRRRHVSVLQQLQVTTRELHAQMAAFIGDHTA